MAWRPHRPLIEGLLDCSENDRVTGWLDFRDFGRVTLDLTGNSHRDLRGCLLRLTGDGRAREPGYFRLFARKQTGKVGDITAGLPPRDYVSYPYVEWFSAENGRIVVELSPDQVERIGDPVPWMESDRPDERVQAHNMAEHMARLIEQYGKGTP